MGADVPKVTTAQRFRDAVWEADAGQLSTTEALILLAYADHARGGDTAWVAQSRLIQRCKLGSKGTPSRVIAELVAKGWLRLLEPAQWRNKQSPTYRLLIPTAPPDGEVVGQQPPRSKRQPPRSGAEPPRSADQTAPPDGAKLPVNRTPLSPERPSGLSGEGELAAHGSAARRPPPDPATPRADGPPMTADEARAQLRQLLAGKGRARFSRWEPRHRGDATPNEAFAGFPLPTGPAWEQEPAPEETEGAA